MLKLKKFISLWSFLIVFIVFGPISKIKSSSFISFSSLTSELLLKFYPTSTSIGKVIEQECCFDFSNISSIIASQFSSLIDLPISFPL